MLRLNSLFKDLILSLLFVLIVFTPPIKFLPYYTWVFALMGLLTLSDKKFVKLIDFRGIKNVKFLKYLFFVLFFNSIIVPFAHGGEDFTYVPLQIGIILTLFRNLFLVYLLHKYCTGKILLQYSKYYFIACCIYVSFTLAFIIDPGFKTFWLDSVLTDVNDYSLDFAVYEFRYSLDGFAAFSSASVFSFACLYCSYLIASSRNIDILKIACLMIMVIGCFFYGRISLVGMLLGAILIIWTSGSLGKTIKIVGIIVAFVICLLAILNTAIKSNDSLLAWQDWAFQIVKQIFVDKKVTDYSATHMVEDMYYMPELSTLILGDGKYTNPNLSYYGHTDVGFMRLLLYGGIFSLLFVYTMLIRLSKTIVSVSSSQIFRRFIFLSLILFLILEMKGESYQRAIMNLYPLLLLQNYNNKIS